MVKKVTEDRWKYGIRTKKIIMIPCSVKNILYVCAVTIVFSGYNISSRISTPIVIPAKKKVIMAMR